VNVFSGNTNNYSEDAYNQIFADFFRSFKGSGGSFEVAMPALARIFYDTFKLSPDNDYIVGLLQNSNSLDGELEVVYFESYTTTFDEYKTVMKPLVGFLAKNQWSGPKIVSYTELEGHVEGDDAPKTVIVVPIIHGDTTQGYIAMFLHSDNCPELYSKEMDFVTDCVYLLALSRQSQLSDARFEHYLKNDYLTDLPNRNHMYEAVVHSLQMAEIFFSKFAILSVKINGLKQVNDSLGMMVGDMALKIMGQVIADAVASVDLGDCKGGSLTGRMSGADFAVLISLPACLYEGNMVVAAYCDAIMDKTREPIEVDGNKLYLSTSVGAAIYPVHGEVAEDLLRKSEMAKTAAKNKAPGTYLIYEGFMGGEADDTLWLNSNLPTAISQNQFELFYQAKIDLKTGDVIGAESLIRWNHPERGMVNPGAFIEFAEQNNYGIDIDKLVLDMACNQINAWEEKGIDLIVSVNISPRHFIGGLICNSVENILQEKNVDPSHLEIELLESIVVEDFDGTVQVINALKELGVSVSLDDFGSGFSSLEYVAKLPIDVLKVDRTFAMNMEKNPSNKFVLEAIIALAKGMGVRTVVEGVENKESLYFLHSIGTDIAQGFFINRPMPVEEFEQFLQNKKCAK